MKGIASRVWRHGLRAAVLLLVGLVASGCLYTNASLTVSGDDRVSGETLLATETPDGKVPFRLHPPQELADRVHVAPYAADGRVGVKLSFHDLSFHEVERLSEAMSPSGSRYEFHLSRSGSLVIFDGSLDLTPLASTDSEFLIELSAPGAVTTTNGQQGAGTVSWRPEPGELTHLSATYQFSESGGQEWGGWTGLLALAVLGTVATIVLLALAAHHRARREAGDRGY